MKYTVLVYPEFKTDTQTALELRARRASRGRLAGGPGPGRDTVSATRCPACGHPMGREVLDRGAEVEERYACPRCGYMLKYVYYREWPCLSSAHLSCAHLPSFPLFLFPLK